MSPKKLVKAFYESDLANDPKIVEKFFHRDCTLHWNSSKGYLSLDYNGIKEFFKSIQSSYDSLRVEISHLLRDGDHVTIRYTMYVRPIEDTDHEHSLAHFINIWEIKDGKFYRGYEISQLSDENPASLKSFSKIKT